MDRDVFRPQREIPQRIYDAFQNQATVRPTFERIEEAFEAEEDAVWKEARKISQEKGLRVLTISEIKECQITAQGHTDYGAKWAYAIEKKLCFK